MRQGFSYTLPDLYSQLSKNGWEVKKVKYDKKTDRFICTIRASHGQELDGWGPSERIAVANALFHAVHRNHVRSSKLSMWQYTFSDQMPQIAEAYSKAPIYERKAAIAFMELGRDAEMRAKTLGEHLEITIVNNPEPYTSSDKMCDDIRKRRKLEVSRSGGDHPIWSPNQLIAFRICFDVLGYCAANADWGWEGTNRAFAAYAPLVNAEAQQALFSEVIGQTAYAAFYRAYGPAKIAIFSEFTDPAQAEENPHDGYRGVHPSQAIAPVALPSAKQIVSATKPYPVDENGRPGVDINEGYRSPYFENPLFNYNLEMDRSALGLDELMQHADNLQTTWSDALRGTGTDVTQEWRMYKEKDPEGAQQVYLAVSNAIRAACLSPRTKLHHNAQQYQDLANVPYDCTDPNVHWDALENARQQWNAARFGEQAREEHRPWMRRPPAKNGVPGDLSPFEKLKSILYQRNPELGDAGAATAAQAKIFRIKAYYEARLAHDNQTSKPEDESGWIIDNEANKQTVRWIDMATKAFAAKHDTYQPSLDAQSPMFDVPKGERKPWYEAKTAPSPKTLLNMHDYDQSYDGFDNHKIFNLQRYGAFMGTHLQAIAQLTRHLEEIVEAALYDVHARDGTGHHFRAAVLSYNAPNVGPKQVSFMWLLLQPLTSQLATIDVHMSRFLGHAEKDINPRDYYRMERELMARRDAMGLEHVPLGLFQWGTWDLQRTGQRQPDDQQTLIDRNDMPAHQDHTSLRVLKPTPAWKDYWLPPPPDKRNYDFDFMNMTDPASEAVVDDWRNSVAKKFQSLDEVPVQGFRAYGKVAKSGLIPMFKHPVTGTEIVGQPGQTLMQHIRNFGYGVGDAWKLFSDDMVAKSLDSASQT